MFVQLDVFVFGMVRTHTRNIHTEMPLVGGGTLRYGCSRAIPATMPKAHGGMKVHINRQHSSQRRKINKRKLKAHVSP